MGLSKFTTRKNVLCVSLCHVDGANRWGWHHLFIMIVDADRICIMEIINLSKNVDSGLLNT